MYASGPIQGVGTDVLLSETIEPGTGRAQRTTETIFSDGSTFNRLTVLEELFALESGDVPYPYSFYGNPDYTANDRLDCVYFLWSFHTGQLQPGPGGAEG